MVWSKLTLYRQDSLLLGCIYRSPNSSLKTSLERKNIIEKANNSGCSHLCMIGDIVWNLNVSLSSEKHPSNFIFGSFGRQLLTSACQKCNYIS